MLKNKLRDHLTKYGRDRSLIDLYHLYPYRGEKLKYKQKIDAVRTVERKLGKHINEREPKILIFDIETAPLRAFVWRLWQQNVQPTNGQLQSNWFMLTYSAKWLFDNTLLSDKLTKEEALAEDDSRIVQNLHKLMDEADVVVAHYGKRFDIPMMNARFILNDLDLPSPYRVVDTKLEASKVFSFPSYKLDYLCEIFGFGRKLKTDFSLWENCLKGDETALQNMLTYNDQDVLLLEELYLKLRPYMKSHPNLNLMSNKLDKPRCTRCMSDNIKQNGTYYTSSNAYISYQCGSCGGYSRARSAIKKDKSQLTV